MSVEGMGECLAVEGATTKVLFETYVERVLAPDLRVGQVVMMDNLSAHKSERVRELIEARGCEVLYLPPYSPDYNPIEEAFSKIKALLRKAAARTRDLGGHRPRRPELLRALWLPSLGSASMKYAVGRLCLLRLP
jgi:transposase